MTAKTLKALKASIRHWNEMATNPETKHKPGAARCALCQLFNRAEGCDGCPVKQTTGLDFCRGTPYRAAEKAFNSVWRKQFMKAAKRERDFLKSLLTKVRTK